ncbi:non-ribosomal peptide synthetase [Goodfellowiella coeruleoviolacea]|uniref:Amino acid adenylation domain-containing protein n=1 Tax=Goodfellowiella coeruleoviolacea TaxID=334858 RepID=A0AAE3GL57_9PSEU|nr:amino acid adenylation domain-containing protein [Goodfellowiella coeruleoviolacea]MCP2170201.1 amino acid adenylation domain-containing protein [Goodfellowiella coeruleoviolacea]
MSSQGNTAIHSGLTGVPASRREQALWLLDRLVPGSGVNNLHLAFRVRGGLDLPACRQALSFLLHRHQVLRTVFTAGETGLRKAVLAPERIEVDVPERACPDETVHAELTAFVARPFVLDGRPLLRAVCLRCPGGDVFCVAVHHLNFDTVSATVLHEEFVAVYDALVAGGQPPAELRDQVPALPEAEPSQESLRFWRTQLRGVRPDDLELSCGTPNAPNTTLAGGQVTHALSAEAVAVVRRLERDVRAPEAVVLLAAYYLLLHNHGAGPDLVVGSPINVRGPAAARAIGYHVNVVPLRVRVEPGESFRELVRRTRNVFLSAITHVDVPVDNLLAEIPRTGSSWRHTVFRHVFNYVPDSGAARFRIGGLVGEPLAVETGYSKFDLEFFVLPSADGIRVRAAHGAEVLDRSDVRALLLRYEALLVALGQGVDQPVADLRGWSEPDTTTIAAANATARPVSPPTVLAAVAAAVAASPAAVAVVDGERQVSYQRLWDAALAVRDLLAGCGVARSGVAPRAVVAVLAPRGPELAAAVLGVWLAGAAYLPLDPDHPEQRLTHQLTDAGARVVLAAAGLSVPASQERTVLTLPGVDEARPRADLDTTAAHPDGCAYLIYTSGSTGRPKGTLVSHASLANLVAHFADELDVTGADAVLWLTTFTFDISALELLLPLVRGGRLVVAPDEARVDGRALRELVRRHAVGIVQATPTTWRCVLDEVADELAGRRVLCGGEPLPPALARRLVATGCQLRNVYGPTETTIWSTCARVDGVVGERVAVGRPIGNTQVFVMDAAGRDLPVGVRGELCIAGGGVAIGYHDRPELTAQRFGDHPRYGRFYRTGDVARWLPDGTLELAGRADRQIKLRGNRIELGEIESVLCDHPEVAGAAVVVAGDPSADAVLVAFVQTADSAGAADRLWQHARAQLPRSWVPQEFVIVDALPTTVNDKVDYSTLTGLAERRRADRAERPDAPADADPLLAAVLGLFAELLGRADVTAGTNFFVHGGHSLLAAKLAQRLHAATGVRLRLAEVFNDPTPAGLAERLRAADASTPPVTP